MTRVLAAVLVPLACACQQAPELAPGQIWAYDNRAGEGASTIQILHIERATPLGDVYFVHLRALNVRRTGRSQGAETFSTTEVWPLVFTREALSGSLRNYQWSQAVDRPYLKQLDVWRREARDGRAADRTFSVPVKDAIDQLELDRPDDRKRRFGDQA
jgi:hypothetical protein